MAFVSIDREECIGDSLTKINQNAQNFDGRITTLESEVDSLQSNVVGINTEINGIFKTGMIMMWSGSISNIPSGWVLCNGQSGAPNLTNRFIVGAGGSYQTGSTGGADAVRLTVQETPSHSHTYSDYYQTTAVTRPGGNVGFEKNPFSGGAVNGVTETGAFTDRTTNSTGNNQFHENRPPYYALAFIMKL